MDNVRGLIMEVGGRLCGGGQKEGKWENSNSINNKMKNKYSYINRYLCIMKKKVILLWTRVAYKGTSPPGEALNQ